MAEVPDHVKASLEEGKKRREASNREYEEKHGASKPTPTQEENDRIKAGEFVMDKEEDGSPKEEEVKTRSVEAHKPSGGYATRASTPRGSHQSGTTS
jgi:hypothetical protein